MRAKYRDRVRVVVAMGLVAGAIGAAIPAFGHTCSITAFQPSLHSDGSHIHAHGHTDCTWERSEDRHEVRLYRVISLWPDDLWATSVDLPPGNHGTGKYNGYPGACEDPGVEYTMQSWAEFTSVHSTLSAKENSASKLKCE